MQEKTIYPFTAIVGQEEMKLALILNLINPALGGVLIRGEKGTAKSTAVRGLCGLLDEVEVVRGCPFHCRPGMPPLCDEGMEGAAADYGCSACRSHRIGRRGYFLFHRLGSIVDSAGRCAAPAAARRAAVAAAEYA